MIQLIHQIVTYFLNPFPYIFILCILLLYFYFFRYLGRRIFALILIIALTLLSTPFLPLSIVNRLESQYAPIDFTKLDPDQEYLVMVLGGGSGVDHRLPYTTQLSLTSLGRLVEARRILDALPQAELITSGNSPGSIIPEAVITRKAALQLGVAEKRIHSLDTPWNTDHEAREYVKYFGVERTLILVTCATHMPRSVHWFKKHGVKNILPAPTNYVVKRNSKRRLANLLPHPENLNLFQKAAKEFIGRLLIYTY